ncbi:MAG: VacJ family lipoprotein [Candidatus Thioglobus sp.]|nr:VacJ family lipoprotein [Candidatus Thioglobus sp.]
MKQLIISLALLFSTAIMADEVDPFEGVNRSIDSFNQALDENIFEPVARAYKNSTPKIVRNRVSDFSDNLTDVITLGNELLQFEVFDSANTFGRIFINSTIGLFGLFDVASEIGLERTREDFGQTMALWGTPAGAYVVLPILGPSTIRDAAGRFTDIRGNNELLANVDSDTTLALTLIRAVDTRTKLLPTTDLLKNADDRYISTRSAYLQKRTFDIYDGEIPAESDDF